MSTTQHTTHAQSTGGEKTLVDDGMNPTQSKKIHELNTKDAARQEKEQAKALKAVESDEKAVRKAKKAEEKSIKRQQKAVKADHKASKKLNKAQAASKKASAELHKANEEVEIKKRHTQTAEKLYAQAKAKIQSTIAR